MNTRTASPAEYVVCVENADYPVSLELHKIYRALPDEFALAAGDQRIVDESGEDYLYPATAFVGITLPERALLKLGIVYDDYTSLPDAHTNRRFA